MPWCPRQTPSTGTCGAEALDHLDRDAGVLRPSGPGEITMRSGAHLGDLVDGQLVVAPDDRRRAQLAEVLREVEGERIVVVDEKDHSPASAIASACSIARALSRVSSYSAAGFESATIPAPAWTCARPSLIVMVRIAMQKSRLPAKSR